MEILFTLVPGRALVNDKSWDLTNWEHVNSNHTLLLIPKNITITYKVQDKIFNLQSRFLVVSRKMHARPEEQPSTSLELCRRSSRHGYQTWVAADMHSRKTRACLWNEGQETPQFGEDGTVILLRLSSHLSSRLLLLCFPIHLVALMPSLVHSSVVLSTSQQLNQTDMKWKSI